MDVGLQYVVVRLIQKKINSHDFLIAEHQLFSISERIISRVSITSRGGTDRGTTGGE